MLTPSQQKNLDKLVGASRACSSRCVGVISPSSPNQGLGENSCNSVVILRPISSLGGPTEGLGPLKLFASRFSSPRQGLGLSKRLNG